MRRARTSSETGIHLSFKYPDTSWPFVKAYIRQLRRHRENISALTLLRQTWMAMAESKVGEDYQVVRFVVSVLTDLTSQGWSCASRLQTLSLRPPIESSDATEEKERQRRQFAFVRQEQIQSNTVQEFLDRMERRRLGPHGWCSIRDLVRDGNDLADRLASDDVKSPSERLRKAIKPYIQIVEAGIECQHTGLLLSDIWRYFRYTWLTPNRSVPGRSMMIIVRDAAFKWHPIIGIAAIASSIVQQTERDKWIGWDSKDVVDHLKRFAFDADAEWLRRSYSDIIDDIYIRDFVRSGVLPRNPKLATHQTVANLRQLGKSARLQHDLEVRKRSYKTSQAKDKWSDLVRTPLFVSKRALALADLIELRLDLAEEGFDFRSGISLVFALRKPKARRACARLIRYCKARRVGINMMDISVCGAIAPYTHILGGKLITLLLASQEVRDAYRKRYERMPSVIASAMKGREILRSPELVLLCTTGLFGIHSSQYNRVKIPSDVTQNGRDLRLERVTSRTEYATFHFSQGTMDELKRYAEHWDNVPQVNGIFGEGVNPRMRKLRCALQAVGLPSDLLLQAKSPRAVYCLPLAENFREILLGKNSEPIWLLPDQPTAAQSTTSITEFWLTRWATNRIQNPQHLTAMRLHNPSGDHGGLVRKPIDKREIQPDLRLFDADEERIDLFDSFTPVASTC